MSKTKFNKPDIFYQNASEHIFDNTYPNSGISSTNTQEAIEEVDGKLQQINNGDGSQLAYSYTQDFNDPKVSNTVKRALDRIITQVDGGLF